MLCDEGEAWRLNGCLVSYDPGEYNEQNCLVTFQSNRNGRGETVFPEVGATARG